MKYFKVSEIDLKCFNKLIKHHTAELSLVGLLNRLERLARPFEVYQFEAATPAEASS